MNLFRLSLLCLTSVLLVSPATAQTHAFPSDTHSAGLQRELDALAQRARPGTFGIAVVDPQSGATWGVHADEAFPMMSVFKAPVAAAVLSRVDAGALSLNRKVTITRAEVDPGSAVPSIGDRFKGEQMSFTVGQLLTAAVSQSDNTAVDALIKLVGGPESVTQFLREHGIAGMRVDEDEAGVASVFENLPGATKTPAGETPEGEHQRLRNGYKAFLTDPRNRATPSAAALFLSKLWGNQLLAPPSTKYLLGLMYAQTVPRRLREGLPPDVQLADKTGSGKSVDGRTSAWNDIGLLFWPDGRTVIVAGFLMDSTATKEQRDALFADLARAVTAAPRDADRSQARSR